jgi:hypothetical protein
MPSTIKFPAVVAVAIAAVTCAIPAGGAFAQPKKQRPVVVVPYVPPSPYAPYYYSRWNPYSAYSVYDHLSGGRQQCQLPTEPYDNNHRVAN